MGPVSTTDRRTSSSSNRRGLTDSHESAGHLTQTTRPAFQIRIAGVGDPLFDHGGKRTEVTHDCAGEYPPCTLESAAFTFSQHYTGGARCNIGYLYRSVAVCSACKETTTCGPKHVYHATMASFVKHITKQRISMEIA